MTVKEKTRAAVRIITQMSASSSSTKGALPAALGTWLLAQISTELKLERNPEMDHKKR
jgi:hypothetical protein